MKDRNRAWRALGFVGGAAAAFCLWWGLAGSGQELHPEGWYRTGIPADLAMASHAGPLRPHPARLDLHGHESVSPRFTALVEGELRVVARVPEQGQLKIGLGGPTTSSPRPPSRTQTYESRMQPVEEEEEELLLEPLPSFEPPPPRMLIVDRGRREAIYGVGLECEVMPAPPERHELSLVLEPERLAVLIDGEHHGDCEALDKPAHVELGAGLRRIQIEEVELRAGPAHFHQVMGTGLRSSLGGWACALAGGLLGAFLVRRRGQALALLPFCLGPALVRWDLRDLLDRLRILDLHEAMAPLLLLGPVALALALATAARRRAPRWSLALAGLPATGLALWQLASGWSNSSLGIVLLGLLAFPWTALVIVNTRPFARRPLASYALVAAMLGLAEFGLRHTVLDLSWRRTAGWERAAAEFEELLVLREHRSYPTEGFPVRPPEPNDSLRLVAFGGSSTGGAFQMDDLELFWPTQLEQLLPPEWEVVNQGVGGWNTLHIRLYVESQLERLRPDLVVLYVGHNDALTWSNQRYADYLARYRRPDPGGVDLLRHFDNSRLFVGFRFAVLAAGQRSDALAVPVDDARDNLQAIIEASRELGARVLLLSEGINPDPLALADYATMQAELAEEASDVSALDTGVLLYESGDPNLFLDACHLSVSGHQALAGLVDEELRRLEWVTR